jgi:hypothetical protein
MDIHGPRPYFRSMTMRAASLVLAALAVVSGCSLGDDLSPNRARLMIEGDAGKAVRLIISTEFVAAVNESGQTRVVIIKSDTVQVTLPYQKEYNIEEQQRFFVETARSAEDVRSLHMQVFVDTRKQFDESGVLIAGQPYRFVYTFNQLITRDILVVL